MLCKIRATQGEKLAILCYAKTSESIFWTLANFDMNSTPDDEY